MHLLLDLFLNSFPPNDVKLLHLLVLQGLRHKLYGKSSVLAHKKICIYCPADQQKFRHQTEKHNVGLGGVALLTHRCSNLLFTFKGFELHLLNTQIYSYSVSQCPSKYQDIAVKLVSSNI